MLGVVIILDVPEPDPAQEVGNSAQLAGEIVACAERTLLSSSARMEFSRDTNFSWPANWRRRRGGLVDPLAGLAKLAIKHAWKKWAPDDVSWRHLAGEGIIEPAARRYMIDFGAYAELFQDGQLFGGRSGRALATLEPWSSSLKQPDPYWMIAASRGAKDASQGEAESIRGVMCKRLNAHIDLQQASQLSGTGLHAPAVPRIEDLHSLPLTVWLDGEHIRRIKYEENTYSTLTVELWDFGVSTADLDWTRLPVFKPTKEATP